MAEATLSPVANEPRQHPIIETMHLAASDHGDTYGVTRIVENWHNDVHDGVFRFCDQQPCHAIGWARGGRA
jgi:hypothetical protein